MAPEANDMRLSPKCDVWSIGTILYLLTTGGTTDKKHEEHWDFRESVWYSTSEEFKEFLMLALAVHPKQRASIDALLQTEFITMAQAGQLDQRPMRDTNLAEHGGNMYKFYMAHCLCEILNRFRLNQDKRRAIYGMREHMVDAKKLAADPGSVAY